MFYLIKCKNCWLKLVGSKQTYYSFNYVMFVGINIIVIDCWDRDFVLMESLVFS